MSALTHQQHIISLMLTTTQNYIEFCMYEPGADSMAMYAQDVAYNTHALKDFVESEDYEALHRAIIQQDTFVREYYYETLVYIEQNNLIPRNRFACI